MEPSRLKQGRDIDQTAAYADMFAALGAEPRLRILRLLLAAHPDGLVVGEIQNELGIAASTLSHHLEKLKNEELVKVRRDSTRGCSRARSSGIFIRASSGQFREPSGDGANYIFSG